MNEARKEAFATALAFVTLWATAWEFHEAATCVAMACLIRSVVRRCVTGKWGFS